MQFGIYAHTSGLNSKQSVSGNFIRLTLESYGLRPTWEEWFLAFWVFTLACEEIRQIIEISVPENRVKRKGKNTMRTFLHYLRRSIGEWASSMWNRVDLLAIVTFYLGFFLRYGTNELDPCDPYVIYTNATSDCEEQEIVGASFHFA